MTNPMTTPVYRRLTLQTYPESRFEHKELYFQHRIQVLLQILNLKDMILKIFTYLFLIRVVWKKASHIIKTCAKYCWGSRWGLPASDAPLGLSPKYTRGSAAYSVRDANFVTRIALLFCMRTTWFLTVYCMRTTQFFNHTYFVMRRSHVLIEFVLR